MANIVIYNKDGVSTIASQLKNNAEYSVETLSNDLIKEAEGLNPDLIILENNSDVTKDILVRTKIPAPLLIVSDHIFTDVTVRAEAYDYVLTPVKNDELDVRVANMLKIRQLKNEINRVSTTDELTGLYNRTYLHPRLEEEISRAKRYRHSISCMLLDIDFFKVVNDMYGYDWGDVLLKRITEILKHHVRKEDILTRYGDEEFLVILPNTDEDNAYVFAERLRRDIERMEFVPDGEEERHIITISGGISSYPFSVEVEDATQTLIRYAEHALYNAKKRGKNKIIQFSQINFEM
ncbi:MAG: diguanylate cyclase [Candidatus Gastranaerophilales bacterium]|nr:diguanylate cyclase [Candidatus Gastranaerophilales bacterium]